MVHTLRYKIFNASKELIAMCRYLEDAAVLVGHCPVGSRVYDVPTRRFLWTEGKESLRAGESADEAADIMRRRIVNP